MKAPLDSIARNAMEMESLMSVCCGVPQGDELPQVAGINDILMDVYSDILNVPRENAASRLHHQFGDEYGLDDMIH